MIAGTSKLSLAIIEKTPLKNEINYRDSDGSQHGLNC
jgi:hypothetical protein